MNIKETYDNELKEYEETSRAVLPFFDEALETLVNNIKTKGDKIRALDVCIGTGILTEKVARKFPNAEYVGVDFSQNMVNIAVKRLKNYKFTYKIADITDKNALNDLGEFDLIITSFGIHNVHGKDQKLLALKNIMSHLKPGGEYISCDIFKGETEGEQKHFDEFQRSWLLKTYDEKETEEWINLLSEEDEPETLKDNIDLLKKSGLKSIRKIWQKEFLVIFGGEKWYEI